MPSLRTLRRPLVYGLLAGIPALAGVTAGLIIASGTPRLFVSSVVFETAARQDRLKPVSDDEVQLRAGIRLKRIVAAVTHDRNLESSALLLNLYPEERQRMPISDAVQTMSKNLTVRYLPPLPGNGDFRESARISFAYPDAQLAQSFLEHLPAAAVQSNAEWNAKLAQACREPITAHAAECPPIGFAVSSLASPAVETESPAWPADGGLGLAGGAVIGALLAMILWRPLPVMIVAGCAAAGVVAVVSIGFLTMSEYTSSAKIALAPSEVSRQGKGERPAEMLLEIKGYATDHELLAHIWEKLLRNGPSHPAFERGMKLLQRGLKLERLGPPDDPAESGLRISYTGSEPVEAQRVIEEVISQVIERFRVKASSEDTGFAGFHRFQSEVEEVDPPSLPEDPNYPLLALAAAGGVLGLIGGAVLARRRSAEGEPERA